MKPAAWLLDYLATLSFSLSGSYWFTRLAGFGQALFIWIFGLPIYQRIHQGGNEKVLKTWRKRRIDNQAWLVCGHTHSAVIDYKAKYINTGLCRFGYLQYLLINNQKLKLETIRYN